MTVRIQFRRGLASQWSSSNPILASGELGYSTDDQVIKIGDGSKTWSQLNAFAAGDISVIKASSGLTFGPETTGYGTSSAGTTSSVELQIATGGVTTSHLANSLVTTEKIANSAVTTAKIADANVTTGKLDVIQVTTVEKTASATLALTDGGKVVEMNVASSNNLTIPPNSSVAFPTGTQILVLQTGAGQTTLVAGSGVTVNSKNSNLKLTARYSGVTLIKRATDTWIAVGDLSA